MSPYAAGKRDAAARTDNRAAYHGERLDEYLEGWAEEMDERAEEHGGDFEEAEN